MANSVLDSLAGEQVLASNPLGAITTRWVVLRPAYSQAEIVIALSRISTVKLIRVSYPGLLVVACAAMLVAAGAASSKQGSGAALPIAFVGVLFAIGYLLARKASVSFKVDGDIVYTPDASPRHAAEFFSVLEKAIARVDHGL